MGLTDEPRSWREDRLRNERDALQAELDIQRAANRELHSQLKQARNSVDLVDTSHKWWLANYGRPAEAKLAAAYADIERLNALGNRLLGPRWETAKEHDLVLRNEVREEV